MVTPEDLERERYEARLKARRDITSALLEAFEKGFKEGYGPGYKEVLEEGLKEGRWTEPLVNKIRLYQRLLRRDEAPEVQLQALPRDELRRLTHQLEVELFGIPSETSDP